MFEAIYQFISDLLALGADPKSLGVVNIIVRALIVYLVGLLLVRLGKNRFVGKSTAFDAILGFMLGTVLTSAIIGTGPFFIVLGAAAILVIIHWVFAAITFYSSRMDTIVKGQPGKIIEDGEIIWDSMNDNKLTKEDLIEALRRNASFDDVSRVKESYFERNGDVSVIPKDDVPRILDVKVEDGVQTIQIKLTN
ncbi:MAG: DUF421 domain-containing protein [Deltaproteobacteria bacterium]